MFVNKLFTYLACAYISERKRCFSVKSPTHHFHLETKILADFQICISISSKEVLLKISNIHRKKIYSGASFLIQLQA